ncbi:MAG: dihydroorotate dehydrogenase electron transfer subunit [Methanotrichaceae archaeon]
MKPINAVIKETKKETRSIKTFRFDRYFDPIPGQYLMVWVRGVDEIPMSFSYRNGITVQSVGDATEALFSLGLGDSVGLRGPLGNGFTIVGDHILLIGGGVGAAPLAFLGEEAKERGSKVTALLGFRCCDDVIFRERFEDVGDLIVTTDDGSFGICGRTSAGLENLDIAEYSQIYLCGPEPMICEVIKRCHGFEEKIQISINRYIKCGMGICGSCCLDPLGIRVCVEGPVIRADKLIKSEFGLYQRGPSGSKE